jgi:hypothetical protein
MSREDSAVRGESAGEQAARIARALQPGLWAQADHIAEMIDPAAFTEYYRSTEPGAKRLFETRQKYMQARARSLAFEIMDYLGVGRDQDWAPIFEQMAKEAPHSTNSAVQSDTQGAPE